MPMTIALALTHPHGAASVGGSTTHWLAIGLLAGMLALAVLPGWLLGLVIAADIVALGWSFGILKYADTAKGHWVWIALAALLIGMYWGVLRGLKHLAAAEYTTRLGNIRKLGRYI
jgi:hypothetical protein